MNVSFKKGISLLEIMLVLVVIAVSLVMAIAYYTSVHTAGKINTSLLQIRSIYQAANRYARDQLYQGPLALTTTVDLGLDNSPTPLVTEHYLQTSDLVTPWQANYKVYIYQSASQTTPQLKISFSLPTLACERLYPRLVATYQSQANANQALSAKQACATMPFSFVFNLE